MQFSSSGTITIPTGTSVNSGEAARLLKLRPDELREAILNGIKLPTSKTIIRLNAVRTGADYEITDTDLDTFISKFESEEPGRHPPTQTRRALLVESSHKCGICTSDAPLQFHHMLEWARLPHHDQQHMLAVCGACHDKIGIGMIDPAAQRMYKSRLQSTSSLNTLTASNLGPLRFHWQDIRDVIVALHDQIISPPANDPSKFDLDGVDIATKNSLNDLGSDYFNFIRTDHEPHFYRIHEFLGAPENETVLNIYHEIIDELRAQLAANRGHFPTFEAVLVSLYQTTLTSGPQSLKGRHRVVNILFSFMYVNCDIGKKPKSK